MIIPIDLTLLFLKYPVDSFPQDEPGKFDYYVVIPYGARSNELHLCMHNTGAEKAGGQVVKVNPRNTSKKCSSCGHINTELTLEDRMYECIECGHTQDRDVNASINIGSLGISESGGNKVLMTPEMCSDIVFSDSSGETLFH